MYCIPRRFSPTVYIFIFYLIALEALFLIRFSRKNYIISYQSLVLTQVIKQKCYFTREFNICISTNLNHISLKKDTVVSIMLDIIATFYYRRRFPKFLKSQWLLNPIIPIATLRGKCTKTIMLI